MTTASTSEKKELIVDIRKQKREHASIHINGTEGLVLDQQQHHSCQKGKTVKKFGMLPGSSLNPIAAPSRAS
jgi:hypothetical protein